MNSVQNGPSASVEARNEEFRWTKNFVSARFEVENAYKYAQTGYNRLFQKFFAKINIKNMNNKRHHIYNLIQFLLSNLYIMLK